jgi:hypothetical protein
MCPTLNHANSVSAFPDPMVNKEIISRDNVMWFTLYTRMQLNCIRLHFVHYNSCRYLHYLLISIVITFSILTTP